VTRRELALLLPLLALYLAMSVAFPPHPDDEASYISLAERLTHGAYVTGDDEALLDAAPGSPDLWFGPGLPGAIAPLVALDAPPALLRLTGPLVLFGAVVLYYILARDTWGRRRGLASAYALGCYPLFWPLLPNLHSEPLAVLFVAAGMLGISRVLRSRRPVDFVLAAGALAGLALTRVAYGWVLTVALVVFGVWWVVTRSSVALRTVAVLSLALVLCLPWLAYTYEKTHLVFHWGNSGSLSLYWMSSPYAGDRGDWRQADDVFTDPALARHAPFFSSLRGLPLAEQVGRIQEQALDNIQAHPGRYAENVAANLARMFVNAPYSDSEWRPNDLFYAVSNAVLLAAVAFSLVVLVPRRRALPPEAGPFLVLALAAFGLHALLAAYPRMLTPIVPFCAWFATLAYAERATAPHVRSTEYTAAEG
jgi:4-amino-4-deoxy-L-arabinose transferase-like glycosyltransferase